MANAIDKVVRAQGGAVVKPHQVKAMILAARRAYLAAAKAGFVDDGESFDVWRRAALHDVVGAAAPSSFRAVTQRDYAAVVRYFLRLAGEEESTSSSTSTSRSADEQRRAHWALNLEEGRLEDYFGGREGVERYADALFQKIHHTSRRAATARQVWAVIFTLRKRAAARRAKTAIGALGASGVPSSPPNGSKRFPAFSRAL